VNAVFQVATFTTDTSLIVRTWDAALARMTGIAADQAVGRPLAEVAPSLVTRGLLARFREVVETGTVHVFSPALHQYLLPCAPSSPSRHFARMQQRATVAPLRDGDGTTGVMVAIEDVTARLDAERDLAAALTAGGQDWVARRAVVRELSRPHTADFAHALVEVIRTHHRDFSILSSSLQLLSGTEVDVSDAIAELLQEPDADLRVQAALALGGQRSARAEDALLAALADVNPNVQFQAIESLGRLGAVRAVDHLVRVAESDDMSLAFAAVDALGAINAPGSAVKIVPLLERRELRPAVIHALGILGDEDAVGPLIQALNRFSDATTEIAEAVDSIYQRLERTFTEGSAVAHITRAALDAHGVRRVLDAVGAGRTVTPALARLVGWIETPEARAALVRLLAEPAARATALEMLPRHGESVVPLLLAGLESDDDDLRHDIVVVLGEIGSPGAAPALIDLLHSAPRLVAPAAGALARVGSPMAFDSLVELLGNPDIGVRQSAVGALNAIGHEELPARVNDLLKSGHPLIRESALKIAGYFGYASAAERVTQLSTDTDEKVRAAALESLPYFDRVPTVALLRRGLADANASVRAAAARALGRVDDPGARQALRSALQDHDQWVRYFATRALAEHRDRDAIETLRVVAARDVAVPVQIAAVEALAAIDASAAEEVFTQLLSDPREELAAAAVMAVASLPAATEVPPQLLRAVDDPRRLVRSAALQACVAHPAESTVRLLQRVAGSEAEPGLRHAALNALARIAAHDSSPGKSAVEVLVAALTDAEGADAAAAALARLPASRLGVIAAHMTGPNPATRRAIVDTLGRSRHSEATALLMAALNDDSVLVRDAALLALGRRRHVV
jgi:HEAT repeat protein